MVIKLHIYRGSPPCRAVMITAKALGVNLEIVVVTPLPGSPTLANLFKINPRRTVPTLEDDGKILVESHAITCYLIDKYDPGNSLYSQDVYKRALINDKLYFDNGVLFAYLHMLMMSFLHKEITAVPEKQAQHVLKAYDMVEMYLNGKDWVCGDEITLADITLFTTVTALHHLVTLEETKYANVWAWINRVQEVPYVLEDKLQLQIYVDWFNKIRSGNF